MTLRSLIFAFLSWTSLSSWATEEKGWPWVLFAEGIEQCSQFGEPIRGELLRAIHAASGSTNNLLPSRIWSTYRQHVAGVEGQKVPTGEDVIACSAFIARLTNPRLSAVVRGEMFLGQVQFLVYDCVRDDVIKGKQLLDDLRDFYRRNDMDYPHQLVTEGISRLSGRKVLNGWDTPHCAEFQKSLKSSEFDFAVSEADMRRRFFPDATK